MKRECPKAEAEWNRRSASRTDELAAIAEAVKILDNDESRDLLSRTTAFFQTSSENNADLARAQRILRAAVHSNPIAASSSQLSMLAEQLKLKPMQKVKEAVKKMAEDLRRQMQEEVKQNDECVANQHQNEKDILNKEQEKEGEERQKESRRIWGLAVIG